MNENDTKPIVKYYTNKEFNIDKERLNISWSDCGHCNLILYFLCNDDIKSEYAQATRIQLIYDEKTWNHNWNNMKDIELGEFPQSCVTDDADWLGYCKSDERYKNFYFPFKRYIDDDKNDFYIYYSKNISAEKAILLTKRGWNDKDIKKCYAIIKPVKWIVDKEKYRLISHETITYIPKIFKSHYLDCFYDNLMMFENEKILRFNYLNCFDICTYNDFHNIFLPHERKKYISIGQGENQFYIKKNLPCLINKPKVDTIDNDLFITLAYHKNKDCDINVILKKNINKKTDFASFVNESEQRISLEFTEDTWKDEWNNKEIITFGYLPQTEIKIDSEATINKTSMGFNWYYIDKKKKEECGEYDVYDLDNKKIYKNVIEFKQHYFEVKPVEWYVDQSNYRLISKENVWNYTYVDYNIELEKFLNTIFYAMLTQKEDLSFWKDKKQKEEGNEVTEANTQSQKITNLCNEIIKLLPNYKGNDITTQKINNWIDKYNNSIDNIANESDKTFSLTLENCNKSLLYSELINKLTSVLEKLKTLSSNIEGYKLMNKILSQVIKSDGNEVMLKEKDHGYDLYNFLIKINNTILPFLNYQPITEEFRNLLSKENDKALDVIDKASRLDDESKNVTYKTFDELEKNFRTKLHPILEEIYELIKNKDVKDEIIKEYNSIAANEYIKQYNDGLSFYLDKINESINNIRNNTDFNPNELEKIILNIKQRLMVLDLSISSDINVSNILCSTLIKLYGIEWEQNNRKQQKQKILNYKANKIDNKI